MEIDRRRALALVSLGVATSRLEAAHQHFRKLATDPASYKLQFFTAEEHQVVDRVAEMILPADTNSPGAHEARVSQHIDLVAANSSPERKQQWKDRLAAFQKIALERLGQPFLQGSATTQAELIDTLVRNEKSPASAAEYFFADMKKATLFAYYTSEVGLLKELGYKGNQVLDEFPGCPHPPGAHREKF